jgi:hypothetical protein
MRTALLLALPFALALAGCPSSPAHPDAATDAAHDTASDVADAHEVLDAADVPVVDVPASDASRCTIDTVYTYGQTGGLTAYTDTTALSPAATWTRQRSFAGDTMPPLQCMTTIPACGTANALTVGDVMGAIADPDVQAALANPPPPSGVYGVDSRPEDGAVFSFQRSDGRGFLVGMPCGGAPGCTEIPPGLATLEGLLTALDSQQLAQPACSQLQ